jgi:hypothetical protein
LGENLKLMESTGRFVDPLLTSAGNGQMGGELSAAAAHEICSNQKMPK